MKLIRNIIKLTNSYLIKIILFGIKNIKILWILNEKIEYIAF